MAIFTRARANGGVDVVNHRIVCQYQGKSDPSPITIDGIVKSQRKIEGKGNLLVVETEDGFRSIYFEKATDVMFYSVRESVENTDDGYDAMRDNYNQKYGYGSWKNRRSFR